jgi:glycosyltransferase involved in cell wall biosynthesis
MRILHTILSRGFAGTERATAEMCNAHCGEHPVGLIVKRSHRAHDGASIRDYLDPRVRVYEVPDLLSSRGMERAIADFRPEIIHAHLRRSTRLLSRMPLPCPTLATLHLWVNGRHFLHMDGLVVIAQWQKIQLRAYRGRVFDIPESLIPHRRLGEAEVAALRTQLKARPGDFLIGGVGRLTHSKGFDVLIKAFQQAQLPRARLAIIGDGRERPRLERLANGSAAFTGFRKDVKDFYQVFDLFVSPSRSEPLGRVVLEALDGGAPVLATATRGPSELLAGNRGRLVPIDDVDAMAVALRELATMRPPRVRPNLDAYHLERVARATLSAYDTLIQAAAQPSESAARPVRP